MVGAATATAVAAKATVVAAKVAAVAAATRRSRPKPPRRRQWPRRPERRRAPARARVAGHRARLRDGDVADVQHAAAETHVSTALAVRVRVHVGAPGEAGAVGARAELRADVERWSAGHAALPHHLAAAVAAVAVAHEHKILEHRRGVRRLARQRVRRELDGLHARRHRERPRRGVAALVGHAAPHAARELAIVEGVGRGRLRAPGQAAAGRVGRALHHARRAALRASSRPLPRHLPAGVAAVPAGSVGAGQLCEPRCPQ